MLSDDMGANVRDYFIWAAINAPEDIGYPHAATISRLVGQNVIRAPGLSDDEAMHINHVMGYLMREAPETYATMCRVYRDRKTLRWMEARGEGDRRTTGRLLAEGLQFLRGALFTTYG